MKKYKIRVRVLPENICCGFIIEGHTLVNCYNIIANLMLAWEFTVNEYQIISIGEL